MHGMKIETLIKTHGIKLRTLDKFFSLKNVREF
jgi:hypothetical protein